MLACRVQEVLSCLSIDEGFSGWLVCICHHRLCLGRSRDTEADTNASCEYTLKLLHERLQQAVKHRHAVQERALSKDFVKGKKGVLITAPLPTSKMPDN